MKVVKVLIGEDAERTIRRFLLVRKFAGKDDLSDSFTARVVLAGDGNEVLIQTEKDKAGGA